MSITPPPSPPPLIKKWATGIFETTDLRSFSWAFSAALAAWSADIGARLDASGLTSSGIEKSLANSWRTSLGLKSMSK